MKNAFQKFIIAVFVVLFTIEPVLQLNQITKAKAADAGKQDTDLNENQFNPYGGDSNLSQPANLNTSIYKIPLKTRAKTIQTDNIIGQLASLHSEEDRKAGIGLEEALSNQSTPRIILNGDDQQAVKIYLRLSGTWMMPDFEREPETIWEQYDKFKNNPTKDPDKDKAFAEIEAILGHKIASVEDVAKIKATNYARYQDLVHYAQIAWTDSLGDVVTAITKTTDKAISDKAFILSSYAEMLSDVTGETVEKINQIFIDNKSATDEKSINNASASYKNLMDTFNENIKAIKLDIRVLNLLVYLVTPKTQGGAGHYKIKVKRILSGYTAPKKVFSRESETLYNSGAAEVTNNNTAADYGQNRAPEATSTSTTQSVSSIDDPDALAIVSDSDGENYNAFVSTVLAANNSADAAVEAENTRNISAHADGQAVDISDVDDIRCTLIKKRRIGGDSKSKFSQRPIKLAWQTTKGYAENGGGDLYKTDMANVLKSFASDSIKELVSEFGGDISSYDGDLSSAGFSDVAMLIGKSIFAQIINSPDSSLKGYNFGDTLTQLGGMYMADYLGLPREMFSQGHIPDSYDELTERIGTAAIEKRLDLPIGTFSGNNLNEMLQKVGQRKLEFEMNLSAGALDNYFKESASVSGTAAIAANEAATIAATAAATAAEDAKTKAAAAAANPADKSLASAATTADTAAVTASEASAVKSSFAATATAAAAIATDTGKLTEISENKDYLIGKAIIEQELNLPKGSFTGNNNTRPKDFAELKKSLSETKANLTFRDPVYADNLLHIDLGITEKMINGTISPYEYGVIIGRTRLDDTLYGLQFMAAKDASYELENGTVLKAINGENSALITIGIKMMAKVFATGDDERRAFTQWVQTNLKKDPANKNLCVADDSVKVSLDPGTSKYKEVTLLEKKATDVGLHSGDMFAMFACPSSNPSASFQGVGSKILRDSLVQYYLTPDEKVKFNLTETNHIFHSPDSDKQFYVTRVYDIITYLENIKSTWNTDNRDPEYLRMKKTVDEASDAIKAILDSSMPVTDVSGAKKSAKDIAVSINKLKADITALRATANRYINKTNGTIIDVTKLVRAVSEIIAGKELPDTDSITLEQIPAMAFAETPDSTVNAPVLNNTASSKSSNSTLIGLGANKQIFMALLSRKMKPADFFLIMACDKMETALNLPQNSLIYFVQNYEKRGLGTLNSLYSAVGQAKIEETFNMPSKYFQGMFLSDASLNTPDFRNDLQQLYRYSDTDVNKTLTKPFKIEYAPKLGGGGTITNTFAEQTDLTKLDGFFNTDGTIPSGLLNVDGTLSNTVTDEQKPFVIFLTEEQGIAQLQKLKTDNKASFDYIVQRAEKRYKDAIQVFIKSLSITNRDLEVSIFDVVDHVNTSKLTDSMRTAEQDVLFRMGIPGSFDGLTKSGNDIAWINASARANQIDKMFNLPTGSTKALFTGEKITLGAGTDRISKKDKQILVAKMGISPVAIDKLLQFLSGDISLDSLSEKIETKNASTGAIESYNGKGIASDITNLGDNPYLGNSSDDCNASAFTQSATTGQMISGSISPDGWFYFDKNIDTREGKTFGSKIQAENYAALHPADRVSYIEELAYGLAKISFAGIPLAYPDTSNIEKQIIAFLKNETDNVPVISDETTSTEIEKKLGVSAGTLQKLFTKVEATNTEVPLVTYKKAVGQQVINRTINSKIFNALGIRIDPSLFSGNEFFEIMQGNFSSLWDIAGSMVDKSIGLPAGSTMKILTAKSSSLRTCAVSEIGGSILGKYVGLDYVSLSGNVYENVGRSRLEKMLGLPRNSFTGNTIDELIDNVGPVNFYLAFKYPVGDKNITKIDLDTPLAKFYSPDYAKSIEKFSSQYKLQKIKEFLDVNTNLSANSELQDIYMALKTSLKAHIKATASNALQGGKWQLSNYDIDNKDEVIAYINRIESIDNTFGISVGTTAIFITGEQTQISKTINIACGVRADGSAIPDPENAGNLHWENCKDGPPDKIVLTDPNISVNAPPDTAGNSTCDCQSTIDKIPVYTLSYDKTSAPLTPNEYIKKISDKTLLRVGLLAALDLFDFDMTLEQKNAVVGILTHYSNAIKSKNYAYLYDNLSTIFSLNLDAKAGLEGGSIKKMLESPGKISDVLIPQAARKIDQQLGLDPTFKWSITGIYTTYFNNTANTLKPKEVTDCGPEQAAIDAKEKELAVRQDALEAWINTNGGYVSFQTGNPNISAAAIPNGYDITKQPGWNEQVTEQGNISKERLAVQAQKTACKSSNRFGNQENGTNKSITFEKNWLVSAASKFCNPAPVGNEEMCNDINTAISNGKPVLWKFAWLIITDFAADKVREAIKTKTKGTIDMPLGDIKHFFFNGDMRYFTAALISYGANVFLNKLNTTDSPDGTVKTVPTAWQISYDMIKLWVVGNPAAEEYAANAAATGILNFDPDDPSPHESTLAANALGDVFDGRFHGGIAGTFFSLDFDILSQSASKTPAASDQASLVAFSQRQADFAYNNGKPLGATGPLAVKTGLELLQSEINACKEEIKGYGDNPAGPTEESAVNDCNAKIRKQNDINVAMTEARTSTRDRFKKQAQYRMMDSVLWTKDKNVFPGLSYILFEGSGAQKNVAIGLYLKNGLINGEFFGQKIGFLQTIEEKTGMPIWDWKLVIDFGIALGRDKTSDHGATLDKFAKTGGLDHVASFISAHSEKWFGVEIDQDYARGLMVSITTGNWGASLNSKDRTVDGVDSKGNKFSYDSLGQVFAKKTFNTWVNKAFSWADRQAGWKPGKAYEVFKTAKELYNSVVKYRQIIQYKGILAGGDLIKKEAFNKAHAWSKDIKDGKGADKAAAAEAMVGVELVAKYITQAAMRWIVAQAGADIAAFETKNNLVPGSAMILIESIVSYGVTNACIAIYNAFVPLSSELSFLGPAALYAALAMFVLVNLFGFYKTELKCSADGYYPAIESPSMANDSNSGIGEWDGMNADTTKNKTIAAAQYKAKRLILDVLEMHKNPIYKDTYASQIMTGRNEDVLSLNESINENMCSVIGLVSIAGICGGNTRAGVWENLQMGTYTHIGF